MICCPVLLILLKGRGKYNLLEGTSCLVGGISYDVPLDCIFLSIFHIPLIPICGCCKILNKSFIIKQIRPGFKKAATRWHLKLFGFHNYKIAKLQIFIIYLYKWWQGCRALHRPSLNAPYRSLNLLLMGPWVTRLSCLRIFFLPSRPGSLLQS